MIVRINFNKVVGQKATCVYTFDTHFLKKLVKFILIEQQKITNGSKKVSKMETNALYGGFPLSPRKEKKKVSVIVEKILFNQRCNLWFEVHLYIMNI